AYKAGGPVQSIHNMVKVLKNDFIIDVVCSAKDLGERQALSGIEPDRWNAFDDNVNVYYVHKSGFGAVAKAIRDRNPDTVYINGVFLPLFNWMPLLMARLKGKRIVFSPRGMLQAGALS